MISTSDMRRGATIELDGRVYQVMEFSHIKMGRGSAQMRMKLRDVRRGDIIERTFQAGEKWPRVRVERVPMQFSYAEGDLNYFMNTETYDQVPLTRDQVGEAMNFLAENGTCDVLFLAAGYLVGATMFLIVNAVTRSASMLRVIVLAALVSAFAAIFGGAGVQFFAWFVLLPFSGAVAASMPTSWLHFGTGPDNAPSH